MLPSTLIARLGALCYIAWGLFHVNVAHDIYTFGSAQTRNCSRSPVSTGGLHVVHRGVRRPHGGGRQLAKW